MELGLQQVVDQILAFAQIVKHIAHAASYLAMRNFLVANRYGTQRPAIKHFVKGKYLAIPAFPRIITAGLYRPVILCPIFISQRNRQTGQTCCQR